MSYNQNGNYDQSYDNSYASGEILSDQAYNLTIGGTLLYGFLINCIMIKFCYNSILSFMENSMLVYMLCYFGMIIAGTFMINKSRSVLMSFIGYNLIVIPLGMILTVCVTYYSTFYGPGLISQAFGIVSIITVGMMFLAATKPTLFLGMGSTLAVTLIITIVVELIASLLGFDLHIIDYVVVLIFCGYIGFDWARANSRPKTFFNAVDAGADLYVDLVNLFLRIMRILSRSRN